MATSLTHPGSTGYDWGSYLDAARASTENRRNNPFVYDPRTATPDRQANTSNLYPDVMQAQGMQPIMGPNGKNIAPNLATILGVADPNDASKLPGGQPLDMAHGLAGLIQWIQQLGGTPEQLSQLQALATPPKVMTGAEMAQAGQAMSPVQK